MSSKNLVFFILIAKLSFVHAGENAGVRPENVFTPKGFDSNDNAQIILAGSLSNLCQKIAPPTHKVDLKQNKIFVESTIYADANCRDDHMMYIPYTSVVNLGMLPEGNYQVLVKNVENKFEARENLLISRAVIEGNSDELLYAPVDELSFRYKDGAQWPELTLKGIFTSTCLRLGSVVYRVKEHNVVEVLPITIKKMDGCMAAAKPIRKSIELVDFPKGKVLIHVRTMNGMALNKVITNLDRAVRW